MWYSGKIDNTCGPYSPARFTSPPKIAVSDVAPSEVVALPNITEAVVRDLLDDMITSIEQGKETLSQRIVPYSEWMTERNIQEYDAKCEEAFVAREAEIRTLSEKKTV